MLACLPADGAGGANHAGFGGLRGVPLVIRIEVDAAEEQEALQGRQDPEGSPLRQHPPDILTPGDELLPEIVGLRVVEALLTTTIVAKERRSTQ